MLKREPESVDNLKALIDKNAKEDRKTKLKEPIGDEKYQINFGIITHKNKAAKSQNLPLFSRITLRRIMKDLRMMGVRANYGFIADASGKKGGKKKERKKK